MTEREEFEFALEVAGVEDLGGGTLEYQDDALKVFESLFKSGMQAARKSRWISVADRNPDKYGEYLCKTKARPHGWVFVYAPVGWVCSDDYPVTEWMPLP